MIFISKKAKPRRVNAEFNYTSQIFLCVDIVFFRQKQCFFLQLMSFRRVEFFKAVALC